MCPKKMYYAEKCNNLKGNIRGTWKSINNIPQEKTSHSKQSSKKKIVSEGKTLKTQLKLHQNSMTFLQ